MRGEERGVRGGERGGKRGEGVRGKEGGHTQQCREQGDVEGEEVP